VSQTCIEAGERETTGNGSGHQPIGVQAIADLAGFAIAPAVRRPIGDEPACMPKESTRGEPSEDMPAAYRDRGRAGLVGPVAKGPKRIQAPAPGRALSRDATGMSRKRGYQ